MLFLTNINLNKNELQNAVIQNLVADPQNGKPGQIYYNSQAKTLKQFDGTTWNVVGKELTPATYAALGGVIVDQDTLTVDGTGKIVVKVPTDNNFSNTLKNKLDGIEAGAQVNIIEGVSVDGVELTPDANKVVDIDLSGLDSKYLTLTGGTMSGSITMGSNSITGLAAPSNNTDAATKKYVDDAITALPEPMVFKGTLGTGGTITSLPTAAAANEGYTYKVITAGTYASQAAKVGDLFICRNVSSSTYEWTYVPSGDEPDGTVTNVATGTGLTGGPITSSGTISIDTTYFNANYKTIQTAVADPAVSGNASALEFISNITQNTKGVITPTKKKVNADSTPTENSTNLVTSGGVYAAIQQVSGGATVKKTIKNSALTASGGAFAWSISASAALGTPDITVNVYDCSTGAMVVPEIIINQTTGAITITINDTAGAGTLTANTYKAVIVG